MVHDGKAQAPLPLDARAFFDAIARRYDRVYGLSGALSKERMKRVVGLLGARRRVLVLGIGTGRELPSLLDAGFVPTGLDVSKEMVAACHARARSVPVVLANFWDPLPFPDASFDAAIALHGTIAHPRDERSLRDLGRELVRVLVPGGRFVAEVPSDGIFGAIEDAGPLRQAGPGRFVHRDEATGKELAGIALDAKGWASLLAVTLADSPHVPSMQLEITPLGPFEHLVVGTKDAWASSDAVPERG